MWLLSLLPVFATGNATDSFNLTPSNGFTLVLLASAYAIGRWCGDLSALAFSSYMQGIRRVHALGRMSSEDFHAAMLAIRVDLEFVCGTVLGAFYFGFWLHGHGVG